MLKETISRRLLLLLLSILPFGCSVGEERSAASLNTAFSTTPFHISPVSQIEACTRVRYWFENFLSPTIPPYVVGHGGKDSQIGQLFSKADWINWSFKDCSTERGGREFFQSLFMGDRNKVQLDFVITMAMGSRPNTVLVLISPFGPEGGSDPNFEKYEHNLKVVIDHLKTGIAKPELLKK
jgi:hypothetical protein